MCSIHSVCCSAKSHVGLPNTWLLTCYNLLVLGHAIGEACSRVHANVSLPSNISAALHQPTAAD